MKRITPLIMLIVLSIMTSCIDKDYDLSQIETDDIAVGNNQSEFKMPLATIHFTSYNICSNTSGDQLSLKQLYDEADIWFPTNLPDGAEYIEIYRILDSEHFDSAYFDSIVHALEEELQNDSDKRTLIASHIAAKYRNTFINALYDTGNSELNQYAALILNADQAEATAIISEIILSHAAETEEAVQIVFRRFLEKLHLENIHTDIPKIEISSDIRDMLLNNLDDSSVENPINCLYLSGDADNGFPFIFQINPHVENTSIDFGQITVHQGANNIEEIRIMRDDMQRLLDGATFSMSLITMRYYPHRSFTDETEFCVKLRLRKTGALQL